MRVFAILTLLTAAASAQVMPPASAGGGYPAPGPVANPLQAGKISGRVVHAVSGAPVARAQLTLRPADPATGIAPKFTTSGPDGTFSFSSVTPGAYRLRGERNGFVATSLGARSAASAGATLFVADGQAVNVMFSLVPQSVIAVTVFDESGEPLQNAQVRVLRNVFLNGRRSTLAAAEGVTNDLGVFRASNLVAGSYLVAATPPAGPAPAVDRATGETRDEAPGPTFFANATELANATPLKVGTAQEVTATIAVARGFTFRIRGSLPALTGAVSFDLVPRDGGPAAPVAKVTASVRGSDYEIAGVLPGDYSVVASDAGANGRKLVARADVSISNRDADGVVLAPVSLVSVSGRVRFEDNFEADFSRLQIAAQPLDNPVGLDAPLLAPVKADGSFVFENVPQGRYRFRAQAFAASFLKSAKFGETAVVDEAISLVGLATPPALEFVLGRKPVTLEVLVDRPEGRDPGTVLVVPDPYLPSGLPLPMNDARLLTANFGGFAVARDLPPGSYRAYAFEDLDPLVALDPAVLAKLADQSAKMTLTEGQGGRVAVKLIPASSLEQ